MVSTQDKTEIAFFDLETTIPTRTGQKHAILEFGSILVCPRTLVELDNYTTLVQPSDISLISDLSVRCNGISRQDVVSAPSFGQIADRVFDILDGLLFAVLLIFRVYPENSERILTNKLLSYVLFYYFVEVETCENYRCVLFKIIVFDCSYLSFIFCVFL